MDSFKLGPLVISANAVTTFEAWTKWKRALSYFIDAKGITSSARKKAILLHKGGPELQEIYVSLEKAHEEEALAAPEPFDFALALLDTHFKPTVNKAYERYIFRLMKQGAESIEQFVVRLRQQAESCGFVDKDVDIVDQIIFGTSSQHFRKKILERRLEKLGDVIELGKLLESVAVQSLTISSDAPSPSPASMPAETVARVTPARQNSCFDTRFKSCSACGRRHEAGSTDCPAREGTCFRCQKKGHFASRCPDRRRTAGRPEPARTPAVSASSSAPKPSSSAGKRDEVKLVRASSGDGESDDSDHYTFNVTSSLVLPQQLAENRVRVRIGGVPISMSVDSGSSKEVVDAHTWERLQQRKVRFTPAVVAGNLYPYGRSRQLEIERAVKVRFESPSSSAWSVIYVLHPSEGRCEPILGSALAKRLNLLRVGAEVVASVSDVADRKLQNCENAELRSWVGKTVADSHLQTGKMRNYQLSLPLDSSVTPVAQGCRRLPFALRKPLKLRTDELLQADIIERVSGATRWVSNIVPAVKKNGDLRLCLDMRRANQAVFREHYPIPTFDEIVTDLHDCAYFSKIDLEAAYHQIELTPESREITTFVTPDGLFRFKRLFFGIRCAPEIFQRLMQDQLRYLPQVRVFFDDIIVFSRSKTEHVLHVQQVVQRLIEKGLRINMQKSIFGVREVEFLGHKISANAVRPNDANVEAVRDFAKPESKKDLQSFLGLINFVSRFIPHYSTLTAPLRALLRKNAVFRWGTQQNGAFATLKASVANMKAAIFDPSAHLMLVTDASPVGLGAVLLQRKPKAQHTEILAFASHSLSPAERNYSQIEREALGIVWGCERFKIYLLGRPFELLTDHKPLEHLFGPNSKPNARLERWIVRLQCFNYSIRHIAGKTNIADPFSRLLQPAPGTTTYAAGVRDAVFKVAELAVPKKFSLAEIKNQSSKDAKILAVFRALQTETPLPAPFVRIKYELTDCEGVLLRGDRIVPPAAMRADILRQAHEGHPGGEAMKRHLRSKVWWPNMDREADAVVRRCVSCTLVGRADPPPPLQRSELPQRAWDFVAIDHLGPLPSGEHVLVVIDYYSRFVELEFTRSTSTAETIRLLWRIFARHGFPSRLKSDNAQCFRSAEFEAFLAEYGVAHVTSPPLWPQANGEVERQNRSLLKRLRIAASEGESLEIAACKYVLMYNSTAHSTTGAAPAQLLFRRALQNRLPSITAPDFLRDTVADRDAEEKSRGAAYADRKRRATASTIQPGDAVFLQARPENKLSTPFERDPYIVLNTDGKEVTIQRGAQSLRRSVAAVKRCPTMEQPPASTPVRSYADVVRGSPPPTVESTPSQVQSSPASPGTFRGWPASSLPEANTVTPAAPAEVPVVSPAYVTRAGRTVRPPSKLDL